MAFRKDELNVYILCTINDKNVHLAKQLRIAESYVEELRIVACRRLTCPTFYFELPSVHLNALFSFESPRDFQGTGEHLLRITDGFRIVDSRLCVRTVRGPVTWRDNNDNTPTS